MYMTIADGSCHDSRTPERESGFDGLSAANRPEHPLPSKGTTFRKCKTAAPAAGSGALHMEPDFKVLFESLPGYYLALDPGLRVVAASDAFLRAITIRRVDISGKHIRDLFPHDSDETHPDSAPGLLSSLKRVRQTREADSPALRRYDSPKPESEGGGFETRYFRSGNSPVLGPDGSLLYIIHTMQEAPEPVTPARQGHNEHVRTPEPPRMEAVRTLAGGIAHHFNNMLAAIIGFTELAAGDVSDRPEVKRRLGNVLKSAMRARDLVRQVLSFSGRGNPQRTFLAPAPIVRSAVQDLKASADRSVEVRLSMSRNPGAILASPEAVEQVLMNLGSNALLALEGKGGIVEVTLADRDIGPDEPLPEADMAPGEYLQLTVTDTGVGMSPDVRERIFEPFFTTRDVGEGIGMGLSVVYGIVKSLRGAVTVESMPGAGSTFRVFLPRARSGEKEARVGSPGVFPGEEEMPYR